MTNNNKYGVLFINYQQKTNLNNALICNQLKHILFMKHTPISPRYTNTIDINIDYNNIVGQLRDLQCFKQ